MKSIKTLLAVAVAVGGLAAAADSQAAGHGAFSGSYAHGGWHGGPWRGGYWGPRVGLYFGAPLLFGAYAWGWPYYDGYYYGPRVVYRDVIREPEVIETIREVPAPQISPAPGAAGAPAQGPLYMNYCASAKAYFPKVTACPEGWKFIAPNQ